MYTKIFLIIALCTLISCCHSYTNNELALWEELKKELLKTGNDDTEKMKVLKNYWTKENILKWYKNPKILKKLSKYSYSNPLNESFKNILREEVFLNPIKEVLTMLLIDQKSLDEAFSLFDFIFECSNFSIFYLLHSIAHKNEFVWALKTTKINQPGISQKNIPRTLPQSLMIEILTGPPSDPSESCKFFNAIPEKYRKLPSELLNLWPELLRRQINPHKSYTCEELMELRKNLEISFHLKDLASSLQKI